MRPEVAALIELACHSAACLPPPLGTGGSKNGPGGGPSKTSKQRLEALQRRGKAVQAIKNTAWRKGTARTKAEREYRQASDDVAKGILADVKDGDTNRPTRMVEKISDAQKSTGRRSSQGPGGSAKKRAKSTAARQAKYGKPKSSTIRGETAGPNERLIRAKDYAGSAAERKVLDMRMKAIEQRMR